MPEDSNHRHCKVCGKVCSTNAEVCSPTCRTKREQLLSAKRTYTYLLYGSVGFLILVLALTVVRV
ncbi:MAG: DUF2116 family Zn-ribbon domain-containing protein [Thermoplasmata archaeon]|nr:DUF2116 family Zn-ribbon domain-containing protein [Thermoplasmata archaeon]